MRITGDSVEGKAELDRFIDPEEPYPVIATTSQLLTTGVDAKTCKLIVLDRGGAVVATADHASQVRQEGRYAALDTQGLELQRMRKTAVQLREQLREIREAQLRDSDPHLVNKAMQTELEALRATRMTEMAEMEELIAELSPLLEEAPTHA